MKKILFILAFCCLFVGAAMAGEPLKVTLKEVGPNKVKVVKIVRNFLDIELKDAFNLVNDVPAVITENASVEQAEELRLALEAEGAVVEVEPAVKAEPEAVQQE